MHRLQEDLLTPAHLGPVFLEPYFRLNETPLTLANEGGSRTVWRQVPRPYLIVSSTSWTPDEDFGV